MQTHPTAFAEKRSHVRHRARTRVSICAAGVAPLTLRRAGNLSANGVYVLTESLGLTPGTRVTLTFVVELGSLLRLHRRHAVVVHLYDGGTGFALDAHSR